MNIGTHSNIRTCNVFWGTHGCDFELGHEGPCKCECYLDSANWDDGEVGGPPYYGPNTVFYGNTPVPQATLDARNNS